MAIMFSCGCGRHFEVAEALAGKRAKCHECGARMTIPTFTQKAAREDAPQSQRKTPATPKMLAKRTRSPNSREEDEPQGASTSVRVAQQIGGILLVFVAIIMALVSFGEMRENLPGLVARMTQAGFFGILGTLAFLKGTFGARSDTEELCD